MLRRIAIALLVVLGVAVIGLTAGLARAHWSIRRERAPLPPVEQVAATAAAAGAGPVRLAVINTASQPMPRSAVLDAGSDPQPRAAYVMSHPSFVLEWADGRLLLVDVGMSREGALAFGAPLEWLAGAQPIHPLGSVAERLGAARSRVRGAVFTHLHTDHVGGMDDLCRSGNQPIRVAMTPAQAERPNYTTRPGLQVLENAACVQRATLPEGSFVPLPDFPGVFVIPAGGHTPGSQIIVAFVGDGAAPHPVVFTGDIVNNIDGINGDVPKPFVYRWLAVPEDHQRQAELRRYLRVLRDRYGFTLLVSHDQRQLEESGVPAWTAAGS
jgi:glyoxylase-like metal-dependent hydrolase (beta-lactamase superfamily II)